MAIKKDMVERVYEAVDTLTSIYLKLGYIDILDIDYCRNKVFDFLLLEGREFIEGRDNLSIDEALEILVEADERNDMNLKKDEAIAVITDSFLKMPREIVNTFRELYEESPKKATDYYYGLCKNVLYVKEKRNNKNLKWKHQSKYGEMDITVNLAKPEKTPEEIKLAKNTSEGLYPKCMLCKENVGLRGIKNPPRAHHRIIPLELDNDKYFLQYSPYSYFNEHLIVFSKEHRPMKVDKKMLSRMMDFTKQFPHYFISSNADLPVVGGSILSHDHYQGGDYVFPVEKSDVLWNFDENIEIMNWPVTSIRIRGKEEIVREKAWKILDKWMTYQDKEAFILNSEEDRHNTLNYFVRYSENEKTYTVYLMLRNNSLDDKGEVRFHTREEMRIIKRENIGIIETIGLAILPKRLLESMEDNFKDESFNEWKHYIDEENILSAKEKVGKTFETILEDVGVYKLDEKGQKHLKTFLDEALR